jgi:hypothetical protein
MAICDMLHAFSTVQHKEINVDVVSRVTEYKIIEQVRKQENLSLDTSYVV